MVCAVDMHPGQAAVAVQGAERRAQQSHLREAGWRSKRCCAICTGSAPQRTSSCASAKVRSVVPLKQNEPVSVSTAVYRQVATSGEIFTPASRASRKIISAVAQALGSIQFTSAKGLRRRVVVDVDEVVLLQSGEAGARDAVAFQDDGGLGAREPARCPAAPNRARAAGDKCRERRRSGRRSPACPCCAGSGSTPAPIRRRRRPAARAR